MLWLLFVQSQFFLCRLITIQVSTLVLILKTYIKCIREVSKSLKDWYSWLSIVILQSLKNNFYVFYETFGRKVLIASLVLSFPLILSGSVAIARGANDNFDSFFTSGNNLAYFQLLKYLLAVLTPIITQLSSLIFGYIR